MAVVMFRNVVQGIKDAKDAHAIFNRQAYETLPHVVSIMPVANQILAAKEHLQGSLGDVGLEGA